MNIVGLYKVPRGSLRIAFDVRYIVVEVVTGVESLLVSVVSCSPVSVSFNKVSFVIVFVKNTLKILVLVR